MYRSLAIILALLPILSAAGGWLPREVAEVRAFVYDYTQEEGNQSLMKGGRLHRGVINGDGTKLDEGQVERLRDALRSSEKRIPGAFCYMPHHGFGFYDAEGVPMGYIELCFQCGNVKNFPAGLPERQWDWGAIRELLGEMEIPILDEDEDYTRLFLARD